MNKMKTIYLLGLFVALVPFIGVPYFWKSVILVVSGLSIFFISYFINKKDNIINMIDSAETSFKQNDLPLDFEDKNSEVKIG